MPDGWAWTRLGVICPYGTCEKVETKNIADNEWILDLEDIEKDTGLILKHITKKYRSAVSTKHRFLQGQLLYSKLRPYLNKVVIADQDGYCTSEILPLDFWGGISPLYMQIYLMSATFLSYVNMISYGVKMPRLGTKDGEKVPIALPPLRQQVIIAKKTRECLQILLSLTIEKDNLKNLIEIAKSKILDLAIRGKLVPQDPNDEPASVLLERIKAEKEELIKQGKIKRDKKESVIFKGEDNSYYEKIGNSVACIDDELPFEIPSSWIWCRGYSCFSGMETRSPNGDFFKYIDIDSIDNKLHKIKCPKVIATKDAPSRANRGVQTGSVLFAFVRPYLENIAYVDEQNKDCIASTGFYVCNSNGALYPLFMYYLMISEYVVQGLNQFMKGDNSPSISKGNIENWLYPIPPSNEQKRICSKLEELIELTLTVEKSLS